MDGKWQIGSLLGIPLYLDPSWFLILGLVTLVNAEDINGQGLAGDWLWLGWIAGLIMALLLFVSVLLHELGHSLMARSQGITVNSITLFLFGGVAAIERESKTPAGAFWVAIAGPLVSFSLSALFFSLIYGLSSLHLFSGMSGNFSKIPQLLIYMMVDLARINLVLGIFNLIPGLPLDGGQVLKAIVWKLKGDRLTGVRWAAASGKLVGWFGICLGLFFILLTGSLSGLWLVLVGWFIRRNADNYDRITELQQSLLNIQASQVMTREFRVVNARLSLAQFAQEYILRESYDPMVYFAASEGRYRGLIQIRDLQTIERSAWDKITLWDIAYSLQDIPSVEEKTPLFKVIEQLEAVSERYLTVLSPAGAVAGIIDRGDVVRAIADYNKLPIPESEIKRVKTEGTYPNYLPLVAIAKTLEQESD
ncbi:site-2 protease family protein [Crocosphaera sp. UHCC 0190]|uniref:site-2 protease family protein n=1 Tax=Crocosphaera sp. UHCC 0190 TaxID=3110246 RepID=UPI002B21E1A6|nr:site-2 protease family protein [Crocosphaera sp. UHCC 0190]MEA5511538.1 site-2 protease family protein [Crocosphaera sp. UHCC 0190]